MSDKTKAEEKELDQLSIISAKLVPLEQQLFVLLIGCVFFSPSFRYSSLVYCPFYFLSGVGMHLKLIDTVAEAIESDDDNQKALDTIEIIKVIFIKAL